MAPLLCLFKFCALFRSHFRIKSGVTVRKRPIWVEIIDISASVTWKFDRWPRKSIGQLYYATASHVHRFVVICEFMLELQSGNADIWDKIVLTSLTLTFCMEITFFNEDFMMIWWQEHGGIVRLPDRQTDGQTDISFSLGEGNLLYGGYYNEITLRYTRVVLQQFRRNFREFGSVSNTMVSLKSTGPSSQSYNGLWEPERWLHNSASLLNR